MATPSARLHNRAENTETHMGDMTDLAERLVEKFGLSEGGGSETDIPGLHLYHQITPVRKAPMIYSAGIIIIIAGRKVAHMEDRSFVYDRENYLTLGLPLVMECEALASAAEPVFALYVKVDPLLVRNVALAMGFDPSAVDPEIPAVEVAPFSADMSDAVERLMRQLCSQTDSAILGESTVREIVYRALQGPAGVALRGLLNRDGSTSRVAQVMETLHVDFPKPFSVNDMARMAGMSPSVFHRAFRQVTNDTPLQYLKKVRLTNASTLIIDEGYKVGSAATSVGYESAAQFSRDFKNLFGVSAVDAKKLGYGFVRGSRRDRARRADGG